MGSCEMGACMQALADRFKSAAAITIVEQPDGVAVIWGDPRSVGSSRAVCKHVLKGVHTAEDCIKAYEEHLDERITLATELAELFAVTRMSGLVPEEFRKRVHGRMVSEYGKWYEDSAAISDIKRTILNYLYSRADCPHCGSHESMAGEMDGLHCMGCGASWNISDPWKPYWVGVGNG